MAKRKPKSSRRRKRKGAGLPPYSSGPVRSLAVPVLYLIILALLLWSYPKLVASGVSELAFGVVVVIAILYLGRELSVRYRLDDERLMAQRLFGSRTVPLESVRKIEPISLRDLSPGGLSGTWGWRSRMWSPVVGKLDAIQTYHIGVLVYGDGVPLFISPRNRTTFIEELAQRVRAFNPEVEVIPEPVKPGGL